MARACTVCTHPKRDSVERAMVDGATYREISGQYGLSRSALERHKNDHLARVLAAATVVSSNGNGSSEGTDSGQIVRDYVQERAGRQAAHVVDVFGELYSQLDRLNRLLDSLHEWLTDPSDSTRYSIDPRADEVSVVYYDWQETDGNGNPKRKKAKLTSLLA